MKPFAWSLSRLNSFEDCPHRYNEVTVLKHFSDANEAADWGTKVHETFRDCITTKCPLPKELASYQKWLDLAVNGPGEILTEQKYALSRDFEPTEWFSPRAWCRVIVDLLRVDGPVALAFDWKTGRVKKDPTQLFLAAQCIFTHFPEVQRVLTRFIWLQEDTFSEFTFDRSQMASGWPELLERVRRLEAAYTTNNYPPRPSGLCRAWCPVTTCKHNGRRK